FNTLSLSAIFTLSLHDALPISVHHFKCGLSKILGTAEEWGYIAENAAQKTKLPRRQHGTERIVLTPVQVQNLVTALNEPARSVRSEEHTSELQSRGHLVCRLLL